MSRMSRRPVRWARVLMAPALAAALVAGCTDGTESAPLTGAAAKTADDNAAKVRALITPQPAGVGETTTRLGPIKVVAPKAFVAGEAGPSAPRPGWTYKRLVNLQGDPQTSLGLVVAPTNETSAKQSAETIARTGGSRDAGQPSGLMTVTTWHGSPAYLVYVNTSRGLHVEALTVETPGGTVTVIAQAPVSTFPQSGMRRALKSVDLAP